MTAMERMTVFKLWDRERRGATVRGLSCDEHGIFLGGDCALVTPITDAEGRRVYCVRPRARWYIRLRPVERQGAGQALSAFRQCEGGAQQQCQRLFGDQVKRIFLAFAVLMLLPPEQAPARDDHSICPMRLPPIKDTGKPRALESVSAYMDTPIEIMKPERYDLPADRFRWVWAVNQSDNFFIECRYTGGENVIAHVPSSATSCEMRAHKAGRHSYRPYSITCQ